MAHFTPIPIVFSRNLCGSLEELEDENNMKVLTLPFHQPYQSLLFKTGHDFYVVDGWDNVFWNKRTDKMGSNNRPVPSNVKLIDVVDWLASNLDNYDAVILPTYEHVVQFSKMLQDEGVPTVNCHATCFKFPEFGYTQLGELPLYHTTTSLVPVRDSDYIITQGHDSEEYRYKKDQFREGILFPINRFQQIGNQVTGYDYKSVINLLSARVIGYNPEFSKYYPVEEVTYEGYKSLVESSDLGLQLSPLKARAFTTTEMMLGGTPVITRTEGNLFPYASMRTFIKDGENGYIANSVYGYLNVVREWQKLSEVKRDRIRLNARETIIDEFPLDNFLTQWNIALEDAVDRT